jgi:hypothetical protein
MEKPSFNQNTKNRNSDQGATSRSSFTDGFIYRKFSGSEVAQETKRQLASGMPHCSPEMAHPNSTMQQEIIFLARAFMCMIRTSASVQCTSRLPTQVLNPDRTSADL